MKNFLKSVIAVSVIFALTAFGFVGVEAAKLLHELREDQARIAADVHQAAQHLNSVTLPAADKTIAQLQGTVENSNRVLDQSQKIQRNINQRITDTSQNLNAILVQGGLAANQVRIASEEQDHYWKRISADTDMTLKSLNQGARGLDQNMNDLHALLADPKLRDAVSQADGILFDTHAMTTDAKSAVHRYTQPPSKRDLVLGNLKDFGGLSYIILKVAQLIP